MGKSIKTEEAGLEELNALGLSWLPQMKQAAVIDRYQSSKIEIVGKWKVLIDAELNRSMAQFRGASEMPDLRRLKRMSSSALLQDRRLMVRNGRLYAHKSWFNHVKHVDYGHMMAEIAARWRLPNAMLLYDGSSTGESKAMRNLPRLVIAKRTGYSQSGFLVPNPYFGRSGQLFTGWRETIEAIRAKQRYYKRNPKTRDPSVFWRGEIEWDNEKLIEAHAKHKNMCQDEYGRLARLEAAALTLNPQNLWNVKCNVHCGIFYNESSQCFQKYISLINQPDIRQLFNQTEDIIDQDRFYEKDEYAEYMYNLNLPGKTEGSYSRNLNHLWFTGSVILLWDWPSVEFYYPALSHGTTHVSVNRSNAIAALSILRKNDDLRSRLIHFALLVADALLCPECIAQYMIRVIQSYREALRYDTVFDNDFFFAQHIPCTQSEMYEIFQHPKKPDRPSSRRIIDCDQWRARGGPSRPGGGNPPPLPPTLSTFLSS